MAKNKYYVVWKGHKTGIFDNWDDCKNSIFQYTGAQYKGYPTYDEAVQAFKTGPSHSADNNYKISQKIILESLSVDAACSGNPGVMEYRGVHTKTKEVWFYQKYPLGTNNIGEFLAIVHGLAELKKRKINIPVYTDSKTALSWINQKKCKSKLERNAKTEKLFTIVERAEKWLKNNSWTQKILKWDTESWGEIPADFGRK